MDKALLEEIAINIPAYPRLDKPNGLYELSRRKEFYDTRPPKDVVLPKIQGTLMPHQTLLSRIFSPKTPYKEGLIFYETGLGKTCIESAIGESFKMANTLYDGKKRPKILILVPGANVERKTYMDIAKKCTDRGTYDEPNIPGILERERKERKNVRAEYEIATLRSKVNKIKDLLYGNIEKLKEDYDGSIIIIDEAHLLKSSSEKTGSPGSPGKASDIITTLTDFLAIIDYTKLILLTATPIWDSAFEIAGLNNILYAKDKSKWLPMKRKPFNKEIFTMDNNGTAVLRDREALKKLWQGKMFYMRQVIADVSRKTMGELHFPLKHIKVVADVMSDTQATYAREQFRKKNLNESPGVESDAVKDAAYRDARDVSTCILNDDGDFSENQEKEEQFLSRISRDPSLLKKYSAKFASIVESVREAQENNKCVFIFLRRVNGPSGSIMLGKILGKILNLKRTKLGKANEEGERYAIISGSDEDTTHGVEDIKTLLKNVSHPKNKFGKFVRVIIGSDVISTGVDIFNIQKVIFPEAYWNFSGFIQALGRVLRVGAYKALIDAGVEPVVEIEYHASVSKDPDELTVDLYMYKIAEDKQEQISRIYRLIKEISVDCGLNYRHNVLATDKDYSLECDFEKCAYKCEGWPDEYPRSSNPEHAYDIPENELIPSKFTLSMFSTHEQYLVRQKVLSLFGENFSLWLDDIIEKLNEHHPILVQLVLQNYVSDKNYITDRYGFPRYINESGNVYFLSDKPNISDISLATYVSHPLLIEKIALEELVEVDDESKKKIKAFFLNPTMENYLRFNYLTRSMLTEKIFQMHKLNEWGTSEKENEILNTYIIPLIYKMKDGNFVSTLEASKPTDVSYNVGEKKLLPNGSIRIFYAKYKLWGMSEDKEQEKSYIKQIKDIDTETVKERLEQALYGAYLAQSLEDGKVRIVSGKRKGGTVCEEKSLEWLLEFFMDAVKKGWTTNSVASLAGESLDKSATIQRLKRYLPKAKFEPMNKDQLLHLLEIASMPKKVLCEELIYELFGEPILA